MNEQEAEHDRKMRRLQELSETEPAAVARDALAYADSLAAQLEAERSKVATLNAECETSADSFLELCYACDEAINCSAALDWIARTKAKLQAAERFTEALHLHPALHALEEMSARDWRISDLWAAMGADEVDKVALELLFYLRDTSLRLGVMASKLDRAFGVSPGMFQRLEDSWLKAAGIATDGKRIDAINPDGSTGGPNPSK